MSQFRFKKNESGLNTFGAIVFVTKHKTVKVQHIPYTSNLVPCNFLLFPTF